MDSARSRLIPQFSHPVRLLTCENDTTQSIHRAAVLNTYLQLTNRMHELHNVLRGGLRNIRMLHE